MRTTRMMLLGMGLALLVAAAGLLLGAAGSRAEGEAPAVLSSTIEIDKDSSVGAELPETLTYETWYDGGSEVVFDHALHVEGMEFECAECHHLEQCSRCHLKNDSTMRISRNQVALHNACFRCHVQEPGGSTCGDCHTPREDLAGGIGESVTIGAETQTALLESMDAQKDELTMVSESWPVEFEIAEPPEDHLFITSHNGLTMVSFGHALHAEGAELECAQCHHLEGCRQCHGDAARPVAVSGAEEAVMNNCIRCHDDIGLPTSCEACHVDPHQ